MNVNVHVSKPQGILICYMLSYLQASFIKEPDSLDSSPMESALMYSEMPDPIYFQCRYQLDYENESGVNVVSFLSVHTYICIKIAYPNLSLLPFVFSVFYQGQVWHEALQRQSIRKWNRECGISFRHRGGPDCVRPCCRRHRGSLPWCAPGSVLGVYYQSPYIPKWDFRFNPH